MKQLVMNEIDSGQRLDKFLGKYLSEAPKSFIYKMLRKKNIVLNGKKADGSEKFSHRIRWRNSVGRPGRELQEIWMWFMRTNRCCL